MALTFEIETDEVLTLAEYVDYVSRTVDFRDVESVAASAPALRKLLNDRNLLSEVINKHLARAITDEENPYTAQVFILALNDDFTVRANLWVPPSEDPRTRDVQKSLYFYQVPHDHNFTFMTGGYVGSGYETLIYEYDYDEVTGEIGQKVDLRFLEHTSLPQSKIMMYRASKDIHSQEHPRDISVSVNLLPRIPGESDKTQYFFDLEEGCVTDYVDEVSSGNVLACQLAALVGDGRTATLIDTIASSATNERVRTEAYKSLALLDPARKSDILERALKDPDPFVRSCVARALSPELARAAS